MVRNEEHGRAEHKFDINNQTHLKRGKCVYPQNNPLFIRRKTVILRQFEKEWRIFLRYPCAIFTEQFCTEKQRKSTCDDKLYWPFSTSE